MASRQGKCSRCPDSWVLDPSSQRADCSSGEAVDWRPCPASSHEVSQQCVTSDASHRMSSRSRPCPAFERHRRMAACDGRGREVPSWVCPRSSTHQMRDVRRLMHSRHDSAKASAPCLDAGRASSVFRDVFSVRLFMIVHQSSMWKNVNDSPRVKWRMIQKYKTRGSLRGVRVCFKQSL